VVALAEEDHVGIADGEQLLVAVSAGVVQPRAHADLWPPRADDGTALVGGQLRGRDRVDDGEFARQVARPEVDLESGGMIIEAVPAGELLSVNPRNQLTVTRLGRGD
jgi:hypothetical protein